MKNHQYVFTINILCLLTLCFYSHNGFPQVFNADQYPPSVKWRQINTENFQVIYPSIFEAGAQRLANDLEILRERVSESLGVKPRKISIILQNQTVESNGNVQLAPRRSEFYTTPPQHSDFQDWLNNLAIHELRHVAQFDKLTGYLRAPFFEQLALAIYGANLPAWFFEGDAVLTETKLSLAGRGRLPSWEMPFRTNLLSGKKYSYQKDYLGSLKNITPGFYELGYFLTWQLEKAYGADILDSLITRIAKLPIRPYNFSSSLKKYTGYNTRQWHEKTREELTQRWEQQLIENAPEDYPVFPDKQAGKPASWLLPRRLADGRVIALHQDVHRVPAIVILDTAGRQDEVAKTGRQTDPHFSYASGKVVWDELRRDKRYGKRTYNVINLYDLEARSYKQLTRKSRYFSPALRPDAKQLIAVSVDEDNAISLVLLDTESGQRIARFPSPENIQLQTPAFDQTGTKVIVTGVSRQGAALIELDLPSGSYRMALPWQAQQIERPTYADNRIIFKAHYNGIDNLYALDTAANTIYQLTNARFGAFNPSVDTSSNRILFNNYQLDGYRISQVEPITSKYSDFKPLTQPNHTYTDNDTTYFEKWASKPYKGLKNIFNFHSLSVDNDNFDNLDDMKPGVYWLSDDLLNTTQLRLGYVYDGDIRSSEYLASVTYQRFFPKFSLEYLNRGQVGAARITSGGQEDVIGLRWRENTATLTMNIPFVFYQRNHVIASGFSTATSYTQRYNLNEPQFENRFIDRIQFPMHYQVYFNHSTRQSMLDLAPRWGQHLSITYRHFPFDNQVSGQLLSLRTAFYFPGLWRNHSLLARFNYQQRNGTYQMANDIPLVSGYDQLRPLPVDNTLLVSYRFPIAYPDWSIGPLAYIKRFKGGFFADFQNVRAGNAFQPRTFGIEFRSDMNLLRYYLPNFDIGIKLVYANEPNPRRRVFATYGIGYSY